MTKKKMQVKYKPQKRERNKNNEIKKEDEMKSTIKTVVIVLVFLGIMYLMMLGLEKMGVFEAGYKEPSYDTAFDYEFINANTVFTRDNSTYYVLFDDYGTKISNDKYINYKVGTLDVPVYKVDMSKKVNSKYKGSESNPNATNTDELRINGITLIKISNGRIESYVVGSDEIEEYLN